MKLINELTAKQKRDLLSKMMAGEVLRRDLTPETRVITSAEGVLNDLLQATRDKLHGREYPVISIAPMSPESVSALCRIARAMVYED